MKANDTYDLIDLAYNYSHRNMDIAGTYAWEPSKLHYAHTQCREKLALAIENGVDVVCQHNTNICRWESAELQVMAEASGKKPSSTT